jgi:hypothetical protein
MALTAYCPFVDNLKSSAPPCPVFIPAPASISEKISNSWRHPYDNLIYLINFVKYCFQASAAEAVCLVFFKAGVGLSPEKLLPPKGGSIGIGCKPTEAI